MTPEVLQDVDGAWSMKRTGFAICASLIVASWIATVFFGIVVDATLLTSITALGGVSGVGIAAERFGGKW